MLFHTLSYLVYVLFNLVEGLVDCGDHECYDVGDERNSEELTGRWHEFGISKRQAYTDLRSSMSFNLYYTKDNYEEATSDTKSPIFKHFDPTNPTKIITHGWLTNRTSDVGQNIKDAYIERGHKVNIIVIDWSNGSFRPYDQAQLFVGVAAKILAFFLNRLVVEFSVLLKDVHLIGHSLGAHISGIAGQYVESGKIGRVTGLDPARPKFENPGTTRISVDSADFVDIIHTSAGGLGLEGSLGHVDFYPNEGDAPQRGCGYDVTEECSHSRAYQIFAEALLNPRGFKGTKCSSWEEFKAGSCQSNDIAYIGDSMSITEKLPVGQYYLKTGTKLGDLGMGDESTTLTEEEKEEDQQEHATLAGILRMLEKLR